MSNYDKWLIKELKENHENMQITWIPIIGWIVSVIMMSFYFPYKFLKSGGSRK